MKAPNSKFIPAELSDPNGFMVRMPYSNRSRISNRAPIPCFVWSVRLGLAHNTAVYFRSADISEALAVATLPSEPVLRITSTYALPLRRCLYGRPRYVRACMFFFTVVKKRAVRVPGLSSSLACLPQSTAGCPLSKRSFCKKVPFLAALLEGCSR